MTLRSAAAARWVWPAALAACVIAAGVESVASRLDANWDLKNYHFYNAYAFLTGRLAWDIAPAQLQTYYNPLLDLPFYYLVRAVSSPRIVSFVMASTAGVAAFCLLRMLVVLFPEGQRDRWLWIGLAFAAGVTGSMGRSVLGSTMNEWPCAMLLLMALAIAVSSQGARSIALASLLVGLAAGLKLTYGVFAVGFGASLLMFGTIPERLRRAVLGAACIGIGFLATYGYWGFTLWRAFDNPFFPYFNDIFRSTWWEPLPSFDPKFGPRDAMQAIFFPIYFAQQSTLVSEVAFRDWRLATLLVLGLAAALKRLALRAPTASLPDATARAWTMVTIFTLVSYLAWLKLFAIYRYLVPLEMVAGPLIVGSVVYLVPGTLARRACVVLVVALLIGTTRTASWGRVDFHEAYFDVSVPGIAPGSLVIMGPSEPMAYVIPFFTPDTRFVYPWNNFLHFAQGNRLAQAAREVIRDHTGAIYSMDYPGRHELETMLPHYGLARDEGSCLPIRSDFDPGAIRLCRVHRTEKPHG